MSADHEWLNLIEVSGPFLAVPVLREVFPQGLDEFGGARRLRSAYDEWRDAVDGEDADLDALHQAWINEVLRTALDADETLLRRGARIPVSTVASLPEHDATLRADVALVDPTHGDAALLLVHVFSPDVDLSASRAFGGLAATPADRMALHLRAVGLPLGLVTNGEQWMVVHAPQGRAGTTASWYARIWRQEPHTLRAFSALLSVRRFFGPQADRLPELFDRSLKHQDEVTDALGLQVRRAIEVLVQALDRADLDRNRDLLRDVEPRTLYEAGLTVMMRLVFLLAAEERGLLLLGDPRYDAFYAISTLRRQLLEDSDEILERRRSAWSRLLAVFRAVFGGIDHPTLRLPAMGGSLFDPDRFPFLEGRPTGTSWRQHRAEPLPIDDRTVLLLLNAIQTFDGRTLSYKGLDVEQVGHVYEGLLERTVARVDDVTLELEGGSQAKEPQVTLGELESASLDGREVVAALVAERSKRSTSAVRNALEAEVVSEQAARLLAVCRGDVALRDRVKPFVRLLRTDPWGYPLVYPKGAFVVALGSDRRETGTHYTPKSLTERIVEETLTPLVYDGPAEGKPRTSWTLRSPTELLDLKVCDPAMGSGAFLVQACRFLGDRLLESWANEEARGRVIDSSGVSQASNTDREVLPPGNESRREHARRLVAERCLYGVDMNPLAVELAKLSLWLVTLSKGKPFGFLDHHLRHGDSLLGIHQLEQLTQLTMNPKPQAQPRPFGRHVAQAVAEALALKARLTELPTLDVRDVEAKAALERGARNKLDAARLVADGLVGAVLAGSETGPASLATDADRVVSGDSRAVEYMRRKSDVDLAVDAKVPRRPLHWPIEFPDVFARENGGFDAFVGNPPFLGGLRITGVSGTRYRDWLVAQIADGRRGSADLVAYFFLRAWSLLREGGGFGLLAVNTIAEGDTRQVGIESMTAAGAVIHAAYPNEPWPGEANVVTSRVHVHRGNWTGARLLLGRPVSFISPFLTEREEWSPQRLRANSGMVFQGSIPLGMGFVVPFDEAQRMIAASRANADVISPFITGDDLNQDPEQRPSRWIISFWDWAEERARHYSLPFERVVSTVKPERDRLGGNATAEGRKRKWWLFGRDAKALYHAVGRGHVFERHPADWDSKLRPLPDVMISAIVGKYFVPSVVANNCIFSNKCAVFAVSQPHAHAALFNSSPVSAWVWQQSSRMKLDLNFSHTDAVETFPFPSSEVLSGFDAVGRDYLKARREIMTDGANPIGLTKLYNRFHDPKDTDPRIVRLREMHRAIDAAVAHAYGWDDLDLGHGYHEQAHLADNDRTRFTISETARAEVIRRLSELNRERYDAEVRAGLHEGKSSRKAPRKASGEEEGQG